MKTKKKLSVLVMAILVALMGLCMGVILAFLPAAVLSVSAENETGTEIPSDAENEPVTSEEERGGAEFDLDAFLAYVQKYADQAGIGDDYAKAVEAIKTAADKKQVTISTVASVAQLAVFLVYLIYLNRKNKKLTKSLKEVSEKLDDQLKGTNGLIDESNANGETGKATKNDVAALKNSMSHLLTGFTLFTDRVNIGAESKEAVKREFNKAAREIDKREEASHEDKTY